MAERFSAAASGVGAALAFGVMGSMLLAVGFSTDQWLVITVNRTQLAADRTINASLAATNLNFYSRTRGLFRECYGTDVALQLLPSDAVLMDKLYKCTPVVYMDPGGSYPSNLSALFWARIHLLRTTVAALCLSVVFAATAVALGAVGCWREHWLRPFTLHLKWAGILMFSAAFFNALGMALFHGCDFLERNSIKDTYFSYFFQQTWPDTLFNATVRSLGFSYILCWVSVFFDCLSAIVLFAIGWTAAQAGKVDDESILDNPAFDVGSTTAVSSSTAATVRVTDVLDSGDAVRGNGSQILSGSHQRESSAGSANNRESYISLGSRYHIPRASATSAAALPHYGGAGPST